jgi:hypothetical protein
LPNVLREVDASTLNRATEMTAFAIFRAIQDATSAAYCF